MIQAEPNNNNDEKIHRGVDMDRHASRGRKHAFSCGRLSLPSTSPERDKNYRDMNSTLQRAGRRLPRLHDGRSCAARLKFSFSMARRGSQPLQDKLRRFGWCIPMREMAAAIEPVQPRVRK